MKNFINIISTLFGIIAALIGIINLFWGNDPFFGLFILLLSVAYFPGLSAPIQRRINITIPSWSILLLSLFIIWASVGVGELFEKIELMQQWLDNSSKIN